MSRNHWNRCFWYHVMSRNHWNLLPMLFLYTSESGRRGGIEWLEWLKLQTEKHNGSCSRWLYQTFANMAKQFNLHWASVCVGRVYNDEKWSFRLPELNWNKKYYFENWGIIGQGRDLPTTHSWTHGVHIKNKVKQISDFVHGTVKISAACEILRNLQ